jgi:hypothetical protein
MGLTLCITGFEADPDRVTGILGIVPTRVGRKGDLNPAGRPKPRPFNGWWYGAPEELLDDRIGHPLALDHILERLRGRADRFAALREQIRPEQVSIYGGLHLPAGDQCGVWLDPNQMRLLAECGIGWGLDFYFDAQPPD